MIKQEIYLEKYDWNVIVCHIANQEDVDEAMDLLSSIDCKGQPLLDAYDHISTDSSNKGLTYTNVSKKTSVVLICKSTSEGEYINSLTHEMFHVVAHIICKAKNHAILWDGSVSRYYRRFPYKFNLAGRPWIFPSALL